MAVLAVTGGLAGVGLAELRGSPTRTASDPKAVLAAQNYGRALINATVGADGFADGIRNIQRDAVAGKLSSKTLASEATNYEQAVAFSAAAAGKIAVPPVAALAAEYTNLAMQIYETAASDLTSVSSGAGVAQAASDALRAKELADRVFDRAKAALAEAEQTVEGTGVQIRVSPVPDFLAESLLPPGWPATAAEQPVAVSQWRRAARAAGRLPQPASAVDFMQASNSLAAVLPTGALTEAGRALRLSLALDAEASIESAQPGGEAGAAALGQEASRLWAIAAPEAGIR